LKKAFIYFLIAAVILIFAFLPIMGKEMEPRLNSPENFWLLSGINFKQSEKKAEEETTTEEEIEETTTKKKTQKKETTTTAKKTSENETTTKKTEVSETASADDIVERVETPASENVVAGPKNSIPTQYENAIAGAGANNLVRSIVSSYLASSGASYSNDLQNIAILKAKGTNGTAMSLLCSYGGSGWESVNWMETSGYEFTLDTSNVALTDAANKICSYLQIPSGYSYYGVGVNISEDGSEYKVYVSAVFTT